MRRLAWVASPLRGAPAPRLASLILRPELESQGSLEQVGAVGAWQRRGFHDRTLHRVVVQSSTPTTVTTIEFAPLGATTATADTVVWLQCGDGDNLRYLSVRVNAVTGLAQIGDLDASGP